MSAGERETGDRRAFLARFRTGGGPPRGPIAAHPAPAPSAAAPEIGFGVLDAPAGHPPPGLVDVFARTAAEQDATVHRVAGPDVPHEILAEIVSTMRAARAVASDEPAARDAANRLCALGVDVVEALGPGDAAAADLGITGASAAIAATGTVVVDCSSAGARWASLLPRVHLCIVAAAEVVATPADVLRRLAGPAARLPANLVLISGPSRTGDIEQLLTLGVHGPVGLHVVVTGVDCS